MGVRMTQRQNDMVRHFYTEGHIGTATKWHGTSLWHGGSLWNSDKMTRRVTLTQRQNDMVRHFDTVRHFSTDCHFCTVFFLYFLGTSLNFFFAMSVITAQTKLLKTFIRKFFYSTCKNCKQNWEKWVQQHRNCS